MAPTKPTIHSLLGLPKSATRSKVNKAYKKAARATHPDHGGSTKAMAALNAAKDAYDNGGVTESDVDTDEDNDGDDNGDIEMNDNESDEDYQESGGSLSDGESVPGSKAEVTEGESDEEECPSNCEYGNLEEMDVSMDEVGLVVSEKKHAKICGCDPEDPNTTHFFKAKDSDNDDTDSGVEDLDAVSDDEADDVDEDVEGEAVDDDGADDIDEGFEDGVEED